MGTGHEVANRHHMTQMFIFFKSSLQTEVSSFQLQISINNRERRRNKEKQKQKQELELFTL